MIILLTLDKFRSVNVTILHLAPLYKINHLAIIVICLKHLQSSGPQNRKYILLTSSQYLTWVFYEVEARVTYRPYLPVGYYIYVLFLMFFVLMHTSKWD